MFFTIRRNRDSKEFGVGDVYFVAGQSNASGYDDYNEDDLDPFYNTGAMNNMARVISFDGEKSKVLSVIGVNQTPNDQKPIKKGLPYNTDANSIFAFSQFSNGTSRNAPRAIYPNGVASWCWSILANKIANENQTPTLFFNLAEPNTSLVLDWWGYPTPFGLTKTYNGATVSTLKGKFHETLKTYGNLLGAKAVLWHQGERDCGALGYGPTQYPIGEYQTKLGNLIELSRQALNDVNNKQLSWYVSKVSYATGGNNWAINGHTGPTSLNPAAGRTDITSKYTHAGLLNAQFNNSNERVYQGVSTDDNGEVERAPKQRIHFSGNSLETLANEWKTAIYNSYSNEAVTATPLLQLTSVTKNSGSSYSLTVNSPGSGATYYWVVNDNGINSASSTNNSNTYTFSGVTNGDMLSCYVEYDGRLYASQPYQAHSGNARTTNFSISPTSYNFSSNGGSVVITINGNATWSISNLPSWVSATYDEENSQITFSTSPSSGHSNETAYFEDLENNNSQIGTITFSQSATTDCQVPLTNLSPTNSNSEWQGYGTMQINKTIDQNIPLKVGGTVPTTSGIGTHAYSRLVYNINNQYTTFSGKVGLDDEVDNSCGGTQKVRFVIKGNNNPTPLWDSGIIGITDVALQFTVSVTGINTLELIVEPLDNNYCDHADWLDPMLSCGTSSCTIPANPTNTYASSPSISLGGSTAINTTCPSGSTAAWSTGQTGNSVTVSPTSTTTYTVKCKNGTCESVGQESVTVTVGTQTTGSELTAGTCYFISPKTNLSNNMQVMGDGSIQRQGATTASNQIWRAVASSGNQLKFSSVANDLYITVGTPNYADHMYLSTNSNNYQSFNVDANAGYYRLSIPTYNVTWDMEGAGGGQYLQNYGNTNEGFLDYRLWRFQATSCPNTTTSGLTNNSCYIIRSVQTNNPLQAMSDGKIKQQSGNGQNDQIWKAESSGNQFMFKTMSNNQYIRVNDANNGTKMELGSAMAFDLQASGNNYRISKNSTTWDMEGAGSGTFLQNWGNTSEPFLNYRLWSFQNVGCPNSNTCTNKGLVIGEAFYATSPSNTNLNQTGGASIKDRRKWS